MPKSINDTLQKYIYSLLVSYKSTLKDNTHDYRGQGRPQPLTEVATYRVNYRAQVTAT